MVKRLDDSTLAYFHSLAKKSSLCLLSCYCDIAHSTIAESAVFHDPVRVGRTKEDSQTCIHDGYVILPPPCLLVAVDVVILQVWVREREEERVRQ